MSGFLFPWRKIARATSLFAILLVSGLAWPQSPVEPQKSYLLKAVCESSDRIVTARFGPDGLHIERSTETRLLQSDISGPHGIVFSPDRKAFYVSIGHGRPYGTLVKYAAEDDRELGQVQLGLFPATADMAPDGSFVYVVNFNLHGDPVPSSVSVVDAAVMMEVARIPTCVMPHGSRVTRDGTHQYSGCMMDDLLVEIDAQHMKVARSFLLSKGKEKGFSGLPSAKDGMASGHPMAHDAAAME